MRQIVVSKIGLYVGRFQPFHLGHMNALRHILRKVRRVIIVIGSAQYSHTLENPFTAGERIVMVRSALDEAKIDSSKYYLIPVPDVNLHKIWVSHIISYTPDFDMVFSNEPLTSRLFREAGFTVKRIPYFKRNLYDATEIRKRILARGDWRSLVPNSVGRFMERIGVDRIRDLARSDKASL